jgi:tripartite-type tricarboxylate transporter receptor subunit TctC
MLTRLAAAAAVANVLSAPAQAAYPERAIDMIIPFGAGGGFDTLGRAVASRIQETLGVSILIRNMPGAGGRRGSARLYAAANDGYTIGFVHFVPLLTDEYLLGKQAKIDYRKFEIIQKISHSRHFVIVSTKAPFKTIADMQGSKKQVVFGSTGNGTIAWVEGNALGAVAGFPVRFVTGYKSLDAAALAVAQGEVDAGVGSSHHFSGAGDKVRAILYLGPKRDPQFPDVPSAVEAGLDSLTSLGSPRVLAAPPGTPKDRMEALQAAVAKAVDRKDFAEWAKKTGFNLDPVAAKDFWGSLNSSKDILIKLKDKM